MKLTDPRIFGPVPSRRLGLSLGVDLLPFKTCTYDCIYCQLGRTTCKTVECKDFFEVSEIVAQLKERLGRIKPDVITFSGSGEPTLYSKIDLLVKKIKEISDIKIALLTNGSLFWKEEIRKKVLDIDIILPTLSSVSEDIFRKIHRPHPSLSISKITEGLLRLREEYQGKIYLELFFVKGINDNDKEVYLLKKTVERLCPDKIQINTAVRPPSESWVSAVESKRLREIKEAFGRNAEVISERTKFSVKGMSDILEMAKRRPIRKTDVANLLGISIKEAEAMLKGLEIKGEIFGYKYQGEIYYRGRKDGE